MVNGDSAVQEDLNPTPTVGYQPGQKKSLQEYAALDAEDESLRRWKESLGIPSGSAAMDPNAPKLTIHTLALESVSLKDGSIVLRLDQPGDLERASKSPLQIPEGIEYAVSITFTYVLLTNKSVGREVLSGLKYLQVVRRAGVPVDRMEEMIGSYPPRAQPYEKRFAPSEAPSGMLARSGTNSVRTR
ncbi:rho GDP dissociation inhibitor [Malassezia yamatoensis]|uniref:Rho GDP dissociation inhibitor n=1 Tax=Malassezia yamatoensis TaxID=253288 RepID=A0AAJ5YNV4_9BASI|nr:rho GDP dissociation inhibitor [Malassezia yamatoensis]